MILKNLRYKIATIIVRRKAARLKRQKALYDFASAKYIGVLCSPKNEAVAAQIKVFLSNLSQKGVKYSVFGYFDGKVIPENFLYLKDIDFITQDDLNFLFIPKGAVVDKFIGEPFDMLINCNIDNYFPVEYISQLSLAKCKVGIMRKSSETCYDVMIDVTKKETLEYFLENLEVYLSNLRNSKIII